MKVDVMLEQGWITEDMAKFLREGKEGVLSVVDNKKFVKVRDGKAVLAYLLEGIDMKGVLAVIYDPTSDEVRRCIWNVEAPHDRECERDSAIYQETNKELIEPYRESALDELFNLSGVNYADYPLDEKDRELSDAYFDGQSEYKAKLDNIVWRDEGAFVAHYENIILIINEGAQEAGRIRAKEWWASLDAEQKKIVRSHIERERTREAISSEFLANPPRQLACAKAAYDAIVDFRENKQVENLKVWDEDGGYEVIPAEGLEFRLRRHWEAPAVWKREGGWSEDVPVDQVTGITWGRQVVYSRGDEESPSA